MKAITISGTETRDVEIDVPASELSAVVTAELLSHAPRLASFDWLGVKGDTITGWDDYGHHRGGEMGTPVTKPTPKELDIARAVVTIRHFLK